MDWNPSCGGATEIRSGKLKPGGENSGRQALGAEARRRNQSSKQERREPVAIKEPGTEIIKNFGFWTAAHWALGSKLHWLARSTISREKSQTPISKPKPATEISDRTKL
jgi:hypothetical protein